MPFDIGILHCHEPSPAFLIEFLSGFQSLKSPAIWTDLACGNSSTNITLSPTWQGPQDCVGVIIGEPGLLIVAANDDELDEKFTFGDFAGFISNSFQNLVYCYRYCFRRFSCVFDFDAAFFLLFFAKSPGASGFEIIEDVHKIDVGVVRRVIVVEVFMDVAV